jgi:aspartyl-tRNA(Asn)/glutamyl-tRNA(Gln) amidotransferase subunit A
MASDDDLAYASAVALIERYRAGALSPVETTRVLLDRLDRLQPRLNAFCVVDRAGALSAVRQSEQRGDAKSPWGRSTACR